MVEGLRAVGERTIERTRVLLEYGLQGLGAVAERGIQPLHLVVEGCLQLIGAAAERRGKSGSVGLEQPLQLIGASADGRFQVVYAGRKRRLQRCQILACAFDDVRELDLLVGQLVDQRRDLSAEPLQALVDTVAGVDESVALAGELLDEGANLALVLLVGAL